MAQLCQLSLIRTSGNLQKQPWALPAASRPEIKLSAKCVMHSNVSHKGSASEDLLSDANIWPGVLSCYEQAQNSGAATKTETQTELVHDRATGISWVIRLATALKSKPKVVSTADGNGSSNSNKQGNSAPPKNPFLPPDPALTVGHLSTTHTLVLNKFNVALHHCLVITRAFQSQGDPLNEQDLHATWRLLKVMPHGGLAFYNCGPHSGRSQPHKHLQVVPLPFAHGLPQQLPIQPLLDAAAAAAHALPLQPFSVRQLTWQCYAVQLPASVTSQQLAAAFSALLEKCRQGSHACGADADDSLSYNVLLTTQHMVVVPRSAEVSGPLAVNSLGFAGTLLVRDEEGASYIKTKGPSAVLAEVGCAWPAGCNSL